MHNSCEIPSCSCSFATHSTSIWWVCLLVSVWNRTMLFELAQFVGIVSLDENNVRPNQTLGTLPVDWGAALFIETASLMWLLSAAATQHLDCVVVDVIWLRPERIMERDWQNGRGYFKKAYDILCRRSVDVGRIMILNAITMRMLHVD